MDAVRRILVALFVLCVAPAYAQVCGTVSNCPTASTPFSGTELLYTVQGGVSKKMTIGQLQGQINSPYAAPHVQTDALLAAATIAQFPTGVFRDSFSATAPAKSWFFSTQFGTCAANGYNNDGGSCRNDASGNSWIAQTDPNGEDIREFGVSTQNADNLSLFQAAVASTTKTGATAFSIPMGPAGACYPISAQWVIGNGTSLAASTIQNIHFVGEGGSSTGLQIGATPIGPCISYSGAPVINSIVRFAGPMTGDFQNVTFRGAFTTTNGSISGTSTNSSQTISGVTGTNPVVGATITGPGLSAGTIVTAVGVGSLTVYPAAGGGAGSGTFSYSYNTSNATYCVYLEHVFRSNFVNDGAVNCNVGWRIDAYNVLPSGVSIGACDDAFHDVWSENSAIAGGSANGSGAFDIGVTALSGGADVCRSVFTNIVGVYPGDPDATGLALRGTDNITFRGGMMFSNGPGFGDALAILSAGGSTGATFPNEVTIYGTATIGQYFISPSWNPTSNGGWGINFYPLDSGDMLDPLTPGHGTIPDFPNFQGCDDRGVCFGWTQYRSWYQNKSNTDIPGDAPSTFFRNTQEVQVTNTAAQTQIQTISLPAIAMYARNSKDYPSCSFPCAPSSQFTWNRIVHFVITGNILNATGISQTVNFTLNLASSSLFTDTPTIANGSSSFRLEGDLTESASNAENFSGVLTIGGAGSATGTAQTSTVTSANVDGLTVDMTAADQIVAVLVQLGNASTNLTLNCESAIATVK